MISIRRSLFVLGVARRRLARRPAGAILVALGIAAGAAALAAVLAGSLVARDRAAERSVRALSGADRALRVTWLGVPGQSETGFGALDRRARRALRAITPDRPLSVLIYRETRFGERLLDLGAVDGLGRWVRLRSGRLPAPCRPARCEVVQLGGSGPVPEVPGARITVVGRGSLVSETPFGSFVDRSAYARARRAAIGYHKAAQPPLLVAEGVGALARLPALESIYRSYSWVVPLHPGSVHPWGLGGLETRVARAGAGLRSGSALFDLDTPVDQLREAAAGSSAGARRLLLIGGQAAALLFAFALLSGSSLRRDHEAARRRLRWLGATRGQLLLLSLGEAAAVAVVATLLGFALGAGAGALIARRAGSPAGDVLRHSLLTGGGFALLAGTALATATLTLLALLARGARLGSFTLGPLEIAAVGALAIVVVGFARGRAEPEELAAGRGTGVLLAILPGLAAFVAAVICARALAPLLRLLARATHGAAAPVRLAVLSLARHPGRSALAASFLVVSVGLALFAATYRSTLSGNEADQAAYAVPQDFIVEEDFSKLVYPLEASSLERFRAIAPGVEASPVIRLPASVEGVGSASSPTVLGIPAGALATLRGWRRDFSTAPPAELARRIRPERPLSLHGIRLADDVGELSVDAGVRGNSVALFADIEAEDGGFFEVRLGDASPGPPRTLRKALPEDAHGGLLVALRLAPTGPGNADSFEFVAHGELRLGPLRLDGRVSGYEGWIGVNGLRRLPAAGGARLRFVVSNQLFSRFRPRQETDGTTVPAVVSPALARAAGSDRTLPVDLTGQQLVVRVVGIAKRVPTVDGDVVLADESWLATALNADTPGAGPVQEVWLRTPGNERGRVAAALRRPPFADLATRSRAAVERTLRAEPLARGSLLTLAGAALAALTLAVAGLLLALVNDLRDERGELLDLETQGATPAILRRHLRLRAAIVTVAGALGGIGLGAVLSVLVIDLVALTANAVLPQPPLRLYVSWTIVGFGAAAYLAATALAIAVVTWLPFREARTRAVPEAA